ncbi:hypothetical protein N7532_010833 [Penicillium argentinense]|uniref:C2H2-type domain-containing protein n=1 Tax=Penicillium argentinense TaxID=1131581 RepID=A0A9W9EQB8_9EURO|nr:uncharacterized protein N7532_010833 [Penicillium argentinense]KAJ5086062.1 hypothetical protein N7532_010833 [Penicillium argentinense]
MALKRKPTLGEITPSKRPHHATLDVDDPIYEEVHSDAEYSASGTPSLISDDLNETPATPFSTTSTRYPSELKTHLCPFEGCTKAFNRPARLQEHMRSHNNERPFQCTFEGCDKTFLRASHLTHHIKSAHTGLRDYVCDRPGCDRSFVTGSRLRRHLAAHDGQDKYRCTEYPPCRETFRKHSTLQKHVVSVHLNQKPFPCTHLDSKTGHRCQMAFDTAGHLRAHESRVHSEKRFSCAECAALEEVQAPNGGAEATSDSSVAFPTYALLQRHIRKAHPPKCPNCPIVCSTPRELRRHLEVAHGDVSLEDRKVFPCTEQGCDRSFTKKGNLTVHIRTVHQGEKRFGCGETDLSSSKKVAGWDGIGCGKRYGSKLALEEHIRTAHMGLQNAKAERRQRLGQSNQKAQASGISTLAALTGHGYAEETGRRISCFDESCEHRFHRDYDLWVHMSAKHGCSEEEVQGLFMQRALLADQNGPDGTIFGIYGLGLGTTNPPLPPNANANHAQPNDQAAESGQAGLDLDYMMQDAPAAEAGRDDNLMIPSHDEMAMIDPFLGYHLMEQ